MCTNLQTRPICLKTRTLHCNLDICKPCPARLCLQTNKLVTVQAAASANNTHLSADKDCRMQILTFHLQTRVDTFADMVCKQNTPICKRSKVSADIVTDSANENSEFAYVDCRPFANYDPQSADNIEPFANYDPQSADNIEH